MRTVDFQQYSLPTPMYDEIAAEYAQILARLGSAASGHEAIAAVERWDGLRRRLATWTGLVHIRFHQDTRNEEYKKAREYCDELEPKLTDLAVQMKRRLMDSPHREAIARRFGEHVFNLWKCDIAAFDPVIEGDLVEQSKLAAEYTALLASAKLEYRGQSYTLSQIEKFSQDPDRGVRHETALLRWGWFGENRERLDALFAELVRVRQRMAEKLGHENFIPVGYERMQRVDYDQADVDRFRREVREHVVPLATELRKQQAMRLGIDPLMAWDEALHDPAGNPKPHGDHDWMVERATQMFGQMGGGLDECFARMRAANLLDLKSREGKAGGGFCESLPELRMPFIYANFVGTERDVLVFTHEMGHAFQCYSSMKKPLVDYLWPTAEACEIHSMGLEFLTWPQMDLFFEHEVERFRRLHLTTSLLFLPYGVAVDHFQHLVYAEPSCSPQDRAAIWQEMERTYLPHLNWGDLAHPASGRRWQAQLHIFGHPFYYIDYTLASTCALQLWAKAATDREGALASYVELCRRGGEAPFRELVRSAGLKSPFKPGCLESVVAEARRQLERLGAA